MLLTVVLDSDTDIEAFDGEALYTYSGRKHFSAVTALEAVVNTRSASLGIFSDIFPRLEKLRLNNSKITSVRDIGCTFSSL
jgi:hypothetical protein